jgi:hypothetical protein
MSSDAGNYVDSPASGDDPKGRWIRVYDPDRKPPDWTGCLSSEEVAVFFSDVETGGELNPQIGGERSAGTCLVFPSLEQAVQCSRLYTARVPRLRCEIFDRRGRAVPALSTIVNPQFSSLVDDAASSRQLIVGGWAALIASIVLGLLEWQSSSSHGLLGVLAVNALALGARLLHWGTDRGRRLTPVCCAGCTEALGRLAKFWGMAAFL